MTSLASYSETSSALRLNNCEASRARIGSASCERSTSVSLLLSATLLLEASLLVAGITAYAAPVLADGRDARESGVVHINGNETTPIIVYVAPGTTVMWKNDRAQAVRVHLDRPVSTLCRDPKSFAISARGMSQSDALSGGDFATLCFLEENEYPFEVELVGSPAVSNGSSSILRGTVRVSRLGKIQ